MQLLKLNLWKRFFSYFLCFKRTFKYDGSEKTTQMFVAAYNKQRCSTSRFKVATGVGCPPISGQLLSVWFLSSVACSTQTRAWICMAGPCRMRQKLHPVSPAAAQPATTTRRTNPSSSRCPSSWSPAWDLCAVPLWECAAPSLFSTFLQPTAMTT